jgi:hypothetical protein
VTFTFLVLVVGAGLFTTDLGREAGFLDSKFHASLALLLIITFTVIATAIGSDLPARPSAETLRFDEIARGFLGWFSVLVLKFLGIGVPRQPARAQGRGARSDPCGFVSALFWAANLSSSARFGEDHSPAR